MTSCDGSFLRNRVDLEMNCAKIKFYADINKDVILRCDASEPLNRASYFYEGYEVTIWLGNWNISLCILGQTVLPYGECLVG